MALESATETPAAPRFQVETATDGVRTIVVPARRPLYLMAFLLFWLAMWTRGGFFAVTSLSAGFQPFLAVWLIAWVAGLFFALSALAWMTTGRETFRVVGGDLEIASTALGITRRRLYRGADVRALSAAATTTYAYRRNTFDIPWLWRPRSGAVKFDYGARTVHAAVGLDEAEGRMIVDALKPRLPPTAG